MITIAVTGGAGMIGSNFIRHVNKHYSDVVVYLYDDLEKCSKRLNNIRDLRFRGAIEPAEELLKENSNYFDLVFHLAANSSTDCSAEDAQQDYLLTKLLAQRFERKLIFASSAGVYGNPDDPYPLSWYALYKKKAEEYILQLGGTAFRFFNVFGPGEEHKPGQNSPFFRYTLSILKNEPIVMYNKNEKRDFVSVDVVSLNLQLAILAHESHKKFPMSGKYFDVGTGSSLSFREVLDIVCTQMKVKNVEIVQKDLSRPTQKFTQATKIHPNILMPNENTSIQYYRTFYHDHIKKMFDNGEIK